MRRYLSQNDPDVPPAVRKDLETIFDALADIRTRITTLTTRMERVEHWIEQHDQLKLPFATSTKFPRIHV